MKAKKLDLRALKKLAQIEGVPSWNKSEIDARMQRAAAQTLRSKVISDGHIPLGQGLSFECFKCGRSCSVNPADWTIQGDLTDAKCGA